MVKTVESILANSELPYGELEVVVVLDGYEPMFELLEDPRVRYIRQENTGMRGAINIAVKEAKGEYIARFDEHIMVCPGFDRILLETIEDDWIVTATRYCLDPVKWEVMDLPPVEYSKLIVAGAHERRKFAGVHWRGKNEECKDVMIGETMAMQGSFWMMKKSWWEKVIVELQSEGYGTHYQDSIEMTFKTWQAGGKLMLNKNVWFAHKHRSFRRTHNYGGDLANQCFAYALSVWEPYYRQVIRPRFKI